MRGQGKGDECAETWLGSRGRERSLEGRQGAWWMEARGPESL